MSLLLTGQIIFLTLLILAVTQFCGIGLTRFLCADQTLLSRFFFSYWVGFAVIGLLAAFFGCLGFPIRASYIYILIVSALLWGLVNPKQNEYFLRQFWKYFMICTASIVVFVLVLMSPVIARGKLTTFSIGNNDPALMVSVSRGLRDHSLIDFLRLHRSDPEFTQKPLTVTQHMISSELSNNPRWFPFQILAFFSALTRLDPELLFSLLITITFVTFLPLIWQFINRTLKIQGYYSIVPFMFVLSNPHIIYILYHGFFPQIMSTGFFIGFLVLFLDYSEAEAADWRNGFLLGLLLSGILMSYLDLFPFAVLIAAAYSIYLIFKRKLGKKTILMRTAMPFIVLALIAPYHVYQLFSYYAELHMKSGLQTGWEVTRNYFLFLFQLGGYFSHPNLEPSLWFEWLLDPLLAFLIFYGLLKMDKKGYMVCIVLPFIISGLVLFVRKYNYAYYKNFTFIYFWLPITVGIGIGAIKDWIKSGAKSKSLAAVVFCILAAGIFSQSSIKLFERINYSVRNNVYVSEDFTALGKFAEKTDIDNIFISDMSNLWDAYWLIYYFNDKNIGLPHYLGFASNHFIVGNINEKRFQYVLKYSEMDHGTDDIAGRKLGREIFSSGRFVIRELL